MSQCTATSKRTHERCRAKAMRGSHLCYHHGAKTPTGIASPSFKTGKYSKYLPARLMDRYNEALADDSLLELRDQIAVVDARLADLLLRVDTGESGAIWKSLQVTWYEMVAARQDGDHAAQAKALNTIGALIKNGFEDNAAWADIRATLLMRKSLVESERKRLVEMQQMISAEKAMVLIAAVASLVKEHVKDRDALIAISEGLTRLVAVAPR